MTDTFPRSFSMFVIGFASAMFIQSMSRGDYAWAALDAAMIGINLLVRARMTTTTEG